MFKTADLSTVADILNRSYDMACKPIIGVRYKKEGRFNKIIDIDLEELKVLRVKK
jgi:hypothetical protein